MLTNSGNVRNIIVSKQNTSAANQRHIRANDMLGNKLQPSVSYNDGRIIMGGAP